MNNLDKRIVLSNWRNNQLSIQILRRVVANLIESAKALGEVETPEEREALDRLFLYIDRMQEEIELMKNRFWELSIEAMNASKN